MLSEAMMAAQGEAIQGVAAPGGAGFEGAAGGPHFSLFILF